MTLKNNRATLLCYFKLCASFHSHQWIQTGRVRKRPIRVKIGHFLAPVTLKFNEWSWKTIGHLSYATSSFVHHFIAISEFKLELESGNAQFRSKSAIFLPLWPWPLTSDLDLLQSSYFCQRWSFLKVSWWYDVRNMVKKVWQTDRRTDGKDHS